MELTCDCEGWKKNANQIFGAQIFAASHGMKYTGDYFIFCPWCQHKLSAKQNANPVITDFGLEHQRNYQGGI